LANRYVFTYTVRISNEGAVTAQLKSRHWIITDGNGVTEEVRGEGVVGNQPVLQPGKSFEYTSYCVLKTPHGSMRGSYEMVREDGSRFQANITAFSLTVPNALN
jgi:ApaG protein